MIKFIFNKYGNNKSERTKNIQINIFFSFILKGISILTSLMLVPLTINYVNPTQYGIWLTLSSIIAWMAYFDLGITLGFKNKFAEAIASDNHVLAKHYVSTTYILMGVLFASLSFIVLFVNQYIDWPKLLHVDSRYFVELRRVFDVLIICFSLNLVLRIVCVMLDALQKTMYSDLIKTIGQIFALIVIYFLKLNLEGSILILAFVYSGGPILVLVVATMYIFRIDVYKKIAPSLKCFDFNLIKNILGLGLNFFIIMISAVLIFQLVNILISRNINPLAVTQYNIAYKYYNVLYMSSLIFLNPLWSAFTDAYTKCDRNWMMSALRGIEKILIFEILIIAIMFICFPIVIKLWIGENVIIPIDISLSVGLLITTQMIAGTYMYLINGIGKVRIQMLIYVIFSLISIPVMNYMCQKYKVPGLLLVPIIVYVTQGFIGRLQLVKLIKGIANGIWNK